MLFPISQTSFWFSLSWRNQEYRPGGWIKEYWKKADAANWLHYGPWILRDPRELKVLKVLIMALEKTIAF